MPGGGRLVAGGSAIVKFVAPCRCTFGWNNAVMLVYCLVSVRVVLHPEFLHFGLGAALGSAGVYASSASNLLFTIHNLPFACLVCPVGRGQG